jgi:hypothetical protein
VRRQEDASPQRAQAADRLPRLPPRCGIESRRRLVEEDELRVADQREGEVETAQLPARQRAYALVATSFEPHEFDDLFGRSRPGVVAGEDLEDLAHREQVVDGGRLEHDSDACTKRRPGPARVVAEDAHVAGISPPVALEDLDGRRLPGAVRAEEREDLAGLHSEGDPVQHLARAVRLAQARDLDDRHSATAKEPAGGKSGSGPPLRAAAMREQSG